MTTKNILITGGAGFIGSHLAERCLKEGHEVTIVDNLITGSVDNIPQGVNFLNFDISCKEDYKNFPVNCDIVFHLAAQSSGEVSNDEPLLDFKINALGTFLILDWCRQFKNLRFIYSSSMAVYGNPVKLPVREESMTNPLSFYGISKLTGEHYVLKFSQFGIVPTIFRLFSVYGPGQNLSNEKQGIVSIFLNYLIKKYEVWVKGSGERFRDFIYIDNVVDVLLRCLYEEKTFGKVYNLCTGRKTSVSELIEKEIELMGFDIKTYPVRYEGSTPNDQFGLYGDITNLEKDIQHAPFIFLKDGLKKVVEWIKMNNSLDKGN